ncbi:MAG: monofunctional biosynthetic peptidoglycan transglycosylase [Acidobacteria bacterium SCN 69-37]|mgnify:CR=1 FL=1|nr:MAG: monofunctional biosynthetic peptidoglycan transglycosylase [Acidobacteria bacterium SCN 69-37]
MRRVARRRSSRGALVFRIVIGSLAIVYACAAYSWLMLPDVRPLIADPPARTAFMDLRATEARAADRPIREERRWLAFNRIAPTLRRAVLVAEDDAFWDHDGVDYRELRASFEASLEDGTAMRGASTITQQLAKNLYLSPSRNPWRKVVELMLTRRLEAELSKTRILELYLNVVEWGDGLWGAEAAARAYFGQSASSLSASQAALMAGALINPRIYSPASPNRRLVARQRIILGRMSRGVAAPAPPSLPASTDGPSDRSLPVGAPPRAPIPTDPADLLRPPAATDVEREP